MEASSSSHGPPLHAILLFTRSSVYTSPPKTLNWFIVNTILETITSFASRHRFDRIHCYPSPLPLSALSPNYCPSWQSSFPILIPPLCSTCTDHILLSYNCPSSFLLFTPSALITSYCLTIVLPHSSSLTLLLLHSRHNIQVFSCS